jgi:hypothetical protein
MEEVLADLAAVLLGDDLRGKGWKHIKNRVERRRGSKCIGIPRDVERLTMVEDEGRSGETAAPDGGW